MALLAASSSTVQCTLTFFFKVCIIRLVKIKKKQNLYQLFDKYTVARTEHDTLAKSTKKIFSNFVAFSENPNFTWNIWSNCWCSLSSWGCFHSTLTLMACRARFMWSLQARVSNSEHHIFNSSPSWLNHSTTFIIWTCCFCCCAMLAKGLEESWKRLSYTIE